MTKEQLGNLIIALEDMLYHVAKTLLRSDADCADAIQEAIVKAFSGIQTLRKDSCAKTWLVRIVINECYAILRREKRLVPIDDLWKMRWHKSRRITRSCMRQSVVCQRRYDSLSHSIIWKGTVSEKLQIC